MGFLIVLAPIALIVLVCGGMFFFMTRGMHGGAKEGSAHGTQGTHGGQQGTGAGDTARRQEIESGVAPRREQIVVSAKGSPAVEPALADPDLAGTKSSS